MINKVEIKMGTLWNVLGFDQIIYPPGKHESQNKINITDISTVQIQTEGIEMCGQLCMFFLYCLDLGQDFDNIIEEMEASLIF